MFSCDFLNHIFFPKILVIIFFFVFTGHLHSSELCRCSLSYVCPSHHATLSKQASYDHEIFTSYQLSEEICHQDRWSFSRNSKGFTPTEGTKESGRENLRFSTN